MENKYFDIVAKYNNKLKSYDFVLDYGLINNPSCTIKENGDVIINYDILNFSKEEQEQFKNELLSEILIPIFDQDAKEIMESGFQKVPSAFSKAEEFIINYDLFVEQDFDFSSISYDKSFLENRNYSYRSVYDEGTQTVTFYIKSKLFDGEVGIFIYPDGSFYPEISVKNINLTDDAKEERLKFIKIFVYNVLKVKINFGTIDGIHPLQIPTLYKRAQRYAKKRGTIQYTDEKGDVYPYRETEPEIVEMNNIGNI